LCGAAVQELRLKTNLPDGTGKMSKTGFYMNFEKLFSGDARAGMEERYF
jgi:hypothetical protein